MDKDERCGVAPPAGVARLMASVRADPAISPPLGTRVVYETRRGGKRELCHGHAVSDPRNNEIRVAVLRSDGRRIMRNRSRLRF